MSVKLDTAAEAFDSYMAAVYTEGFTPEQYKHVKMAFYGGAWWMLQEIQRATIADQVETFLPAVSKELSTNTEELFR